MVTTAPHPLFSSRVGGRLCLDFVNTVRARMRRAPAGGAPDFQDVVEGERLTDVGALIEWATWTGGLTRSEARAARARAAAHPREAAVVYGRALQLREAIYRLCRASLAQLSPLAADLDAINREWHVARAHEVVAVTPAGRPRSPRAARRVYRTTTAPAGDRLERMLWPVVSDAVALLTGDDLARLGQCPAIGCGWLFVDHSRSGRRQWCDMAVCGNADKVRRFRARQRARSARLTPARRR